MKHCYCLCKTPIIYSTNQYVNNLRLKKGDNNSFLQFYLHKVYMVSD